MAATLQEILNSEAALKVAAECAAIEIRGEQAMIRAVFGDVFEGVAPDAVVELGSD